ncbi:hypothetical protein RI129_001597 [Pyrocoelia pectoralis]|uniref:cysteine--tRNA ligase n=1 Tax=Pyrocoelia pectoralis TaxID=417401 RepID=A0AAN7VVW1_9COLE
MGGVRKILHLSARYQHNWIKPVGFDTGIKVYNCRTQGKVPFIVRNKDSVTWYTCGPTVYDSSHIGHASCYVKLDIIRRILQNHFSLNLITVMNITDIDDKIITKSSASKISINDLAKIYEKEFWEDMHILNVLKPHVIMRVSENIPLIERFIMKLLKEGHAYKDNDGSILFQIGTYGKLQNVNREQLANFTVWKAAKENEPSWMIQCGAGRPGWHTECSAMASAIFGSEIDIHAGGIDLKFPHHENEEAQCCAYFSKQQWVNYWLHTGHLVRNAVKMSKSLQNTTTIRGMLELCSGNVFRMMCLMSHYRKNMEFSEEYVHAAKTHLETYTNFLINCNIIINNPYKPHIEIDVLNDCVRQSVTKFSDALKDDFDTAQCIKIIDNLISVINRMLHNSSQMSHLQEITPLIGACNFVTNMLHMFGFNLSNRHEISESNETELTNILTKFRQNVRAIGLETKNSNLISLCDSVRDDLYKLGVSVKDHKYISLWSKI